MISNKEEASEVIGGAFRFKTTNNVEIIQKISLISLSFTFYFLLISTHPLHLV